MTHPTSTSPDNGLTFRRDGYYARYYSDGKQLFRKLHTADTAEARSARDAFYATITPRVCGRPGRRKNTPPGASAALPPGVSYRKPFHLKIGGVSHGHFHTMKDVEAAYARVRENADVEARRP